MLNHYSVNVLLFVAGLSVGGGHQVVPTLQAELLLTAKEHIMDKMIACEISFFKVRHGVFGCWLIGWREKEGGRVGERKCHVY